MSIYISARRGNEIENAILSKYCFISVTFATYWCYANICYISMKTSCELLNNEYGTTDVIDAFIHKYSSIIIT